MGIFELIGASLGIVNVWLSARQSLANWPVGIVYIIFSLIVFADALLYGQVLLHIVYLVITLYGWWNWWRGSQNKVLVVTHCTWQQTLSLITATLLLAIIFGQFFFHFSAHPQPHLDSLLSVGSCFAMWLLAQKKIEHWIWWMVINAVAIWLYGSQGLYGYVGLSAILFVMAIVGYRLWKKSLSASPS